MPLTTSPSYSFTMRLKSSNKPGILGTVTSTIGTLGGDIGAIDIVSVNKNQVIRDYTINAINIHHSVEIADALNEIKDVEVTSVSDRTFLIHIGGKISIENKIPLKTRADLSRAYTPGVARVCTEIAKDKSKAYRLTIKRNTIAIVTDGSAVLGLGDIGPEAAMPVMEGKAMLFKEFGGVNAFPICLDTKDPDEIVNTICNIAPTFGGINLEDISSPRCFEIERKLKERLEIPIFHDDQHGTSIVVLAATLNALRVVHKKLSEIKIAICGAGAAGLATARLLHSAGARNIICVDSTGIISKGREKNMNVVKESILEITNPNNDTGSLADAMRGADLFIGVSSPDIVSEDMVKSMAKDGIVFALSNPIPEIAPELAAPHVRIVGTGRSDFQNQINNVLCFPGLFKGLLDCNATTINHEMQIAASEAIANVIKPQQLSEDYIIPSVFDKRVAEKVSKAVIRAARKTKVARRSPRKRGIEMW